MADIAPPVARVADGSSVDNVQGRNSPVAAEAAPSRAGNDTVAQIKNAPDAAVGEHFGTLHIGDDPATTVKNDGQKFQDLQNVYDRAVTDPQRRDNFHDRMETIQKFDGKTFDDMSGIAAKIGANPPISAAETGRQVAKVMQDTIQRHSADGNPAVLSSDNMTSVLRGMSGLMLAERANFGAEKMEGATKEMVDSAERQLRTRLGDDGVMQSPGRPDVALKVHGVTFANNGDPGLSAYSDNLPVDRHKI